MGQPKIKGQDAAKFVRLAKAWAADSEFSWQLLREAFAFEEKIPIEKVWSRQALARHATIKAAFDSATSSEVAQHSQKRSATDRQIAELQCSNDVLKAKYEHLLARHRLLSYNVGLRANGKELLLMPIPTNVRAQTAYTARAKLRRNTPF